MASFLELHLSNSDSSPSQVVIGIILTESEKPSPIVPHFRLPFISSWEKQTPSAHICAQLSAAHPSVLAKGGGYKNNFIFLAGS
jgi:hypothetical protein